MREGRGGREGEYGVWSEGSEDELLDPLDWAGPEKKKRKNGSGLSLDAERPGLTKIEKGNDPAHPWVSGNGAGRRKNGGRQVGELETGPHVSPTSGGAAALRGSVQASECKPLRYMYVKLAVMGARPWPPASGAAACAGEARPIWPLLRGDGLRENGGIGGPQVP